MSLNTENRRVDIHVHHVAIPVAALVTRFVQKIDTYRFPVGFVLARWT